MKRDLSVIAVVVVCLLVASSAHAATYTWAGLWNGSAGYYLGTWSGSDWWTTPVAYNGIGGSSATIQPTDNVVVKVYYCSNISGSYMQEQLTLDTNATVNNITFGYAAGSYTDSSTNFSDSGYYDTYPLEILGSSTLTVNGAFTYDLFGTTPFAPNPGRFGADDQSRALYLQNAGDSFTGTITVNGGMLYAANSGSLGVGTSIVLGSAGQFGGIGSNYGVNNRTAMTLSQNIALSGNGGIIGGYANGFFENTGTVSGSGLLLVVDGSGAAGMSQTDTNYFDRLDGSNTGFGGGLVVANGGLAPGGANNLTNDVFGTGNILITGNGLLEIDAAANIGAGAKIYVDNTTVGGGLLVGQVHDYMPAIDPSSSGDLVLGPDCGTNINMPWPARRRRSATAACGSRAVRGRTRRAWARRTGLARRRR